MTPRASKPRAALVALLILCAAERAAGSEKHGAPGQEAAAPETVAVVNMRGLRCCCRCDGDVIVLGAKPDTIGHVLLDEGMVFDDMRWHPWYRGWALSPRLLTPDEYAALSRATLVSSGPFLPPALSPCIGLLGSVAGRV